MIASVFLDYSGTGNNFQQVFPRNVKQLEMMGVWAFYSPSGSLESQAPSVTLKDIDLEFYNGAQGRDAYNIWQYRNGTMGIGVGIPMYIADSANPTQPIWNGVLDIANERVTWEPDKVVAPAKQVINLEWFLKICASLDFYTIRNYVCGNGTTPDGRTTTNGQLLMGAPGTGAVYEYKVTAYTITNKSIIGEITMLFHFIGMIQRLGEAIKSTGKTIANLVTDATNSATIAYSIPFIIQIIGDAIAIVYDIIQDIVLLAEVVGNLELIINQFGIIDKYKYSMLVTDIIYAVLTYINQQNGNPNLSFVSSILGQGRTGYNNAYATLGKKGNETQGLTIMPKKKIIVNQSWKPLITNFVNGLEHPLGDETKPDTLGPPYGCADGNVKKFFQDICVPFNASLKLIPIGGKNNIEFEEIHYWETVVSFTIPNEGTPGLNTPTLPRPEKTNWHEGSFNTWLHFELDGKDGNTDQRYNGTTSNVFFQPKVGNIQNWSNPGGKEIKIPFALTKTKQWNTITDDILNIIQDLISVPFDILAGFYNGIAGIINTVNTFITNSVTDVVPVINWSWIGLTNPPYPYLELTEDVTGVPKLFMGRLQGTPPGISSVAGFIGVSNHPFYGAPQNSTPNSAAPWNGKCWQPSNNDSIYPDPNGANYTDAMGNNQENESWVSADVLMRLFHSNNLLTPALPPFNPSAPYVSGYSGGNQWLIYMAKQFKMTVTDFLSILQTGNVINWVDGLTPCFLERLTWRLSDDMAVDVHYRINTQYTNNLTPPQISIDGTNV